MNCLAVVINGYVLFSTGIRITAFDFRAPFNIVCDIMSCWEIDIESLSAVYDKRCKVKKKASYLAGSEPRSLAYKAKL